MQANHRFDQPQDPDPSRTFHPVVRRAQRAARHLLGTALLSVALLGQSIAGVAAAAPYTHPAHTGYVSQALPSAGAPGSSRYFSVTGKAVKGVFLSTFTRFGLSSIGYPLSDERVEDGRTVQYFERVRMEYHPEKAKVGYSVLMTRLGATMSQPVQPFPAATPFASTSTRAYVPQTRHSISAPFLSYWKTRGGVELFGYPISEPMVQDGLKVQWFERARFEYHPELERTGNPIQLSLLGEEAFKQVSGTPQAGTEPAPSAAPPAAESPAQPKAVAPETALQGMESYLLKGINEQRAAAGLKPVQLNTTLTGVARSRSGDMAERNYFSHTTPDGKQFFSMLDQHGLAYKYAGEILARNNFPDDQASQIALTSYLNSPPHKAIIMDGRYNIVGIGYAKSGEDSMQYFTVLLVQQ